MSDLVGVDWPTTGAAKAEAYLTAYDGDGPCKFYVDTATGGKVRFGPTIPITLAADGTFTVAGIPDSSETGLSYALTLTYRPARRGRHRRLAPTPPPTAPTRLRAGGGVSSCPEQGHRVPQLVLIHRRCVPRTHFTAQRRIGNAPVHRRPSGSPEPVLGCVRNACPC